MDYGMQNYLKILTESEQLDFSDEDRKEELRESIDKMDLFEDNNMSRMDMAQRLNINEEDVDTVFGILSKNFDPKKTLNMIDEAIHAYGIDSISPEDSDEVFHYLKNGELYKDTIVCYNKMYYVGSVGSLMESNFDINRLDRIK